MMQNGSEMYVCLQIESEGVCIVTNFGMNLIVYELVRVAFAGRHHSNNLSCPSQPLGFAV